MIDSQTVKDEFERVRDLPSLHKHYATQAIYQRWHNRFVRAGFIQKGPSGWKKAGKPKPIVNRAKYSREWRRRNPGRAREHVARYWAKRLGVPVT